MPLTDVFDLVTRLQPRFEGIQPGLDDLHGGGKGHANEALGKAGRNRWLGRRPRVRGMAMNPVDHPNGGGQGKSKGGGGRQHLVSPWGQLAKGFPTRRRSKPSSSQILVRHNGRPPRNKK